MSLQPSGPPPRMDRYILEGMEFSQDFSTVVVTYLDTQPTRGPVTERIQWAVDLLSPNPDLDLRERISILYEDICDFIDEAARARTPKT